MHGRPLRHLRDSASARSWIGSTRGFLVDEDGMRAFLNESVDTFLEIDPQLLVVEDTDQGAIQRLVCQPWKYFRFASAHFSMGSRLS